MPFRFAIGVPARGCPGLRGPARAERAGHVGPATRTGIGSDCRAGVSPQTSVARRFSPLCIGMRPVSGLGGAMHHACPLR